MDDQRSVFGDGLLDAPARHITEAREFMEQLEWLRMPAKLQQALVQFYNTLWETVCYDEDVAAARKLESMGMVIISKVVYDGVELIVTDEGVRAAQFLQGHTYRNDTVTEIKNLSPDTISVTLPPPAQSVTPPRPKPSATSAKPRSWKA